MHTADSSNVQPHPTAAHVAPGQEKEKSQDQKTGCLAWVMLSLNSAPPVGVWCGEKERDGEMEVNPQNACCARLVFFIYKLSPS